MNGTENINGLQIAFLGNLANHIHSVQIGLPNILGSLSGLQTGLINIVMSRFPDKGISPPHLLLF